MNSREFFGNDDGIMAVIKVWWFTNYALRLIIGNVLSNLLNEFWNCLALVDVVCLIIWFIGIIKVQKLFWFLTGVFFNKNKNTAASCGKE